jgi:flagellar secretion chaperone FliS
MTWPMRTGQSAARVYAEVDRVSRALGATPHGLVAILYDELLLALGVARRAAVRGDGQLFEDRRARVLLLLGALEHGLDRSGNATLSDALAATYRGLSVAVGRATPANADRVLVQVRDAIAELADAWGQIAKAA